VKPEEIKELFHDLRAKVEAGTISEDEFEAQLREFLFQDESGTYWTVGAQTQSWYRHENGDWVRASPPEALKSAGGKKHELGVETPPAPVARRGRSGRRVVLIAMCLLLAACLVVTGVLYLQLGRSPRTTAPAADSPTAVNSATSTVVPEPIATTPPGVATAEPTEEGSPTPQVTATRAVASWTPPPPTATRTAKPTATSVPPQVFRHAAPELVLPEDGTERGRGYEAVLIWKPVDALGDAEYYHVEVCWNECSMYEGSYARETTWVFPEFRRGQSVDDKYYWHVTVRQQKGGAPAGPSDPATSPPSETWVFTFPD
jgi:hypothetical protein